MALNWTLDFEDPRREYAIVPDAPAGAHAIAGVNSVEQPEAYAIIAALLQEQRALSVETFYRHQFWNKWLAQLTSDDLAKRVFDSAVNMGGRTAVGVLQGAVNSVNVDKIEVDKNWGPSTVCAANSSGPSITSAFQGLRSSHYRAIVDAQPQDAKYLAGWLARAMK